MAEQEQELERVSSKLESLRGSVGQIMEMLQFIRAKMDTQITVVSEITGPTLEPQPTRIVPSTLPPIGLPYSFTPHPEVVPGVVQSTQQTVPLPLSTEAHPMVHTFAPSVIHTRVQPYFKD